MKILASDFDNTLLFHDQEKSYYRLEDVQAIKKFQAQGNLLVFVLDVVIMELLIGIVKVLNMTFIFFVLELKS